MKDTQLYERMLGLEKPWAVESVRLERELESIVVKVRCHKTVWVCPDTRQRIHVHGYEKRRWRHLDTCQYKTIIEADVPRLKYPDGKTRMLDVPWAEGSSRFSCLFERLGIDLLLSCSVTDASAILRIGWDAADAIKSRAVARGLLRSKDEVPERICIDEKSFRRGHDYVTCIAEVGPDGKARVLHVSDDRKEESLVEFFSRYEPEQLEGIKAASVDMWKPYLKALKRHLPGWQTKVSHDPFHLMGHMNKAVNETRKSEHAQLRAKGDQRLKATRQLWLYGEENLTDSMLDRFDALKDITLKTGRAWSIKEFFREFLRCNNRPEAEECFKLWHQWACRCKLPAVQKVARMFKKHLSLILNYFVHHLTNGPIEGLNNKIQSLVKKAYGFRNKERFKTDILFHLGGLDMNPA